MRACGDARVSFGFTCRSGAWLRLVATALLAFLFEGREPLAETAADPVEVRAAVHPDFARLVLEFPEPVTVERRWDGRALVLRFDRPFRASLEAAAARLDDHLAVLRPEENDHALRLELEPGIALGRFRQFEPELVVLDLMAADAVPEAGLGEVAVRVGEHDDYHRLVLDFAAPVVHGLNSDGPLTRMTFDQAIDLDAPALGRQLRSVVDELAPLAGVQPGLSFRLRPGIEADVFALDEDKLVVDFRGDAAPGSSAAADAGSDGAADAESSQVADGQGDRAPPGAFDVEASKAPEEVGSAAGSPVAAPAVSAGSVEGAAGSLPPPIVLRPHELIPPPPSDGLLMTEPPVAAPPLESRRDEAAERQAVPGTPTSEADDGPAPPGGRPTVAADRALDRSAEAVREAEAAPKLAFARTPRGLELSATWPKPVAAAAFVRAGVLWVVFDAGPGAPWPVEPPRPDPGLQAFIGEPELEQPADGIVVLRLPLKRELQTQAEQDGRTWRLLLRPDAVRPPPIDVVRLAAPRRLRVEGPGGGRLVRTTDPLVGDRLLIWPLQGPVRGVVQARRLVQFELPATAHGVVVRQIADGLKVEADADALEIAAVGGLHVSLPGEPAPAETTVVPLGYDNEQASSADQAFAGTGSLSAARPEDGGGAAPPGSAQGRPGADRAGSSGAGPVLPDGRRTRPSAVPAEPDDAASANRPGAPPIRDLTAGERGSSGRNEDLGGRGEVADPSVPGAGGAAPPTPARSDGPLGLAAFALIGDAGMIARRAELLQRISSAGEAAKDEAQLDLARFFLAQGMAGETLSVLEDVPPAGRADAPRELARQALRGAALLLLRRVGAAEQALDVQGLDGDPEVALWRAALFAATLDWPAAADELARSEGVLASYPDALKLRLGIPAAMIALESATPLDAFNVLAQVDGDHLHPRDRAQLDFIRGLVHARIGEPDQAIRIWREVAAGPDEETRIKAGYALVTKLFHEGRISAEEALARLIPARPLWRGHVWQASMLDGLAEIQQAAGNPGDAIRTWQELQRLHPAAAEPLALPAKIDRAFQQALAGPDGDPLGAVRALALYRDHPDLLPAGRRGRELRRALAERLADLDLLEPAGELLSELLDEGPAGVEAARDGATLAALELRTPDPKAALALLERTAAADLPAELEAERRILRARALDATGRPEAALDLLAGREDPISRALRSDILWRQRDWRGLIGSLESSLARLAASGDDLSPDDQADIVRLAIAHGQAGGEGLPELRQKFGPLMRGQPTEAAFLMATGPDHRETEPDAILAAAERQVQDVRAYLEPSGGR